MWDGKTSEACRKELLTYNYPRDGATTKQYKIYNHIHLFKFLKITEIKINVLIRYDNSMKHYKNSREIVDFLILAFMIFLIDKNLFSERKVQHGASKQWVSDWWWNLMLFLFSDFYDSILSKAF